MKYLITGCGRSGTLFASKLFSAVGSPCSHEVAFGAHVMKHHKSATWNPNFHGEASWLAAPVIKRAWKDDLVILHQLRDPIEVIRSMVGIGSMGRETPYQRYIFHYLPELREIAKRSQVEACMAFWVLWNDMIAHKTERFGQLFRYHVESLDPDLLSRISDSFGLGLFAQESEIRRAMQQLGTKVHTRTRNESITWETLPEGVWKRELRDATVRYGYKIPAGQEEAE
jgi:hypothetical protein